MINILAFAGSTRIDSFNKKLLKAVVFGAREAGANVTVIDLRDFPLPVFDGDLEVHEGVPENGRKIKKLFMENHGLLFALPEYNSSMSGVFKNTIDWVSREEKGELPLQCFTGKVAGLVSASPGKLGGIRGLSHVRSMLENINVLVMPEQICVSNAHEAFDENDNLKNEKQKKTLEKLGANLVDLTMRVRGFNSY